MTSLSCLSNVKRTTSSVRPKLLNLDAEFIGDRSGSMITMQDAPTEGVKNFIEKHKELYKDKGGNIHITIRCFDDIVEIPYSGPIEKITDKDIEKCINCMKPRNTTRLYDTIIEAITEQGKRISGKDVTSILSVFTDGKDNVSFNTYKEVHEEITKHKKRGVVCQFLAANQDAIATGSKYGFDEKYSIQVTPSRKYATSAFTAVSETIHSIATDGDTSGFSELQRIKSASQSDRNQFKKNYKNCPLGILKK